MGLPRRLRLSLVVGLPALALALGTTAAAPQDAGVKRPRRIVSLNLCADQYLLALADRDQIVGLTRNARDPEMSAAAGRVGSLHVMGDSTEEVLALDPDLIVGIPAGRADKLAALSGRSYRIVELGPDASYADIVAQTRLVAAAVGHPERGEALVRRMDAELAKIGKTGEGAVAAYYQRRGYMTGTGTLVDELMTRVGLVNLAAQLGKPPLSQVSLEEMVAARPDFLIMESATEHVVDQGTEMLHHPALAEIERVYVPQAWTVCGGPAYVWAARMLAEQVRR